MKKKKISYYAVPFLLTFFIGCNLKNGIVNSSEIIDTSLGGEGENHLNKESNLARLGRINALKKIYSLEPETCFVDFKNEGILIVCSCSNSKLYRPCDLNQLQCDKCKGGKIKEIKIRYACREWESLEGDNGLDGVVHYHQKTLDGFYKKNYAELIICDRRIPGKFRNTIENRYKEAKYKTKYLINSLYNSESPQIKFYLKKFFKSKSHWRNVRKKDQKRPFVESHPLLDHASSSQGSNYNSFKPEGSATIELKVGEGRKPCCEGFLSCCVNCSESCSVM